MELDIPLNLSGAEATRFLDLLRGALRGYSGWAADHRLEGGKLVEDVTVRPPKDDSLGVEGFSLGVVWDENGLLERLVARVTQSTEAQVRALVTSALTDALRDEGTSHFIAQQFAYLGQRLDGEYHLPGPLWIAPFDDSTQSMPAERILLAGVQVTAVTRDRAVAVAHFRLQRFMALLSWLIGAGIYRIPVEFRWVRGGDAPELRQLGFHPSRTPPTSRPEKGEFASLGQFEEIERLWPFFPYQFAGRPVKLPGEARRLLRTVSHLSAREQEAFSGATNLFQISLAAGRYYPSVQVAYQVATVDALNPGASSAQSFKDLVAEFAPEAPEEVVANAYGAYRSAHFHSGRLPAGEQEYLWTIPFSDPDAHRRQAFPFRVAALA